MLVWQAGADGDECAGAGYSDVGEVDERAGDGRSVLYDPGGSAAGEIRQRSGMRSVLAEEKKEKKADR